MTTAGVWLAIVADVVLLLPMSGWMQQQSRHNEGRVVVVLGVWAGCQ
jgi:hypothetical protein